ncbi:MAG: aminotransferase class [Frankiales bacterium]|nr:aminotransferase class [Frankiales bacterium]
MKPDGRVDDSVSEVTGRHDTQEVSAQAWVRDRVPTDRVHLDVAGAGRVSTQVLATQVDHLREEAAVGAYVAEAAAKPRLDEGRDALGALVGLSGIDVFFTDGASTAFATVLDAWPLPEGARIGTVGSEFASNALLLSRRARAAGWHLVELPVDGRGHVSAVPDGLDLLALPMVPSQLGITQPVAELIASGVPLVLDVAQAAGQVDVPPGAAAYVGTSRKWLCGPRGVGFGAVAPVWHDRLTAPAAINALDTTGITRFDSADPHVAGRLGLSLAARSWSPALLPLIHAASAAARVLLDGAGGWEVVEPVDDATGITTLRHPTADPVVTRAALVDRGFVLAAVPVTRSADLTAPRLRVSTAAWVTPGDLEALATALDEVSR